MKEWPQKEILGYEKEILGFYLSGHPLTHYRVEIKEFTDVCIRDLKQSFDGEEVKLVGLINSVKLTNTKKTNERMAILKLEDMDGETEVVVFPSAYNTLAGYIKEGEVVFVRGRVSLRDNEPKIIASDMKQMQDVYGSIKAIKVDLSNVNESGLEDLKKKLSSSPGKVPVYLKLNTTTNKSVQILVGEDLFVSPNENLVNEIKDLVGQECFSLSL